MMSDWETKKLGILLTQRKEQVVLDPDIEYILVTISNKGDVRLREKKKGATISAKNGYIARAGDFIYSRLSVHTGAFGIVPPELDNALITNEMPCFEIDEDQIYPKVLVDLVGLPTFLRQLKQLTKGMGRVRIKESMMLSLSLVLPPLTEQSKLIRKIDHIKTNRSILNAELTHQQTLLKKLRQQVLQEAIEGKLTKDWRIENPDVEPANELLKRIQAEKAQLIKDKKIKKQKPLPPIREDELPFELPDGWILAPLANCSINKDEFRIPVTKFDRNRKEKIYNYYGASGVIDKIDDFTHEGRHLLIGEDGANLVARSTPIAFIADGKFWVNNHAHVIETIDQITLDYLKIHINGIDLKSYITGGFQPKLSQGRLNSIVISFPPLPEQKAIVAKVEKLLAFCDQLQTQITTNQTHANQLMQAVLKEAFSQNSE